VLSSLSQPRKERRRLAERLFVSSKFICKWFSCFNAIITFIINQLINQNKQVMLHVVSCCRLKEGLSWADRQTDRQTHARVEYRRLGEYLGVVVDSRRVDGHAVSLTNQMCLSVWRHKPRVTGHVTYHEDAARHATCFLYDAVCIYMSMSMSLTTYTLLRTAGRTNNSKQHVTLRYVTLSLLALIRTKYSR